MVQATEREWDHEKGGETETEQFPRALLKIQLEFKSQGYEASLNYTWILATTNQ